VSLATEDAVAFDQFLGGSATDVAAIARAPRLGFLDAFPGASEWFDPCNRLLASGATRNMRDLQFAIIPHKAHVKLRSVADVDAPWLKAAITARHAIRQPAGQ
jgi:hypothetical protein